MTVPVQPSSASTPAPAKSTADPGKGQYGVALLMVLACLAVLMPVTASFSYTSRVDWQAAINLRDEVAARNIERGALRLSLLLFELQRMVFSQKQFRDMLGTWDITQIAPYLMSAFGEPDGAEQIAGLASMAGFDGLNAEAFKGLSLTQGQFQFRVEAESGKLNINCLADDKKAGKETPQARTVEALDAMLMPKIYDPLFDEVRSDGQRYNRVETVRAMVDYIDDDVKKFDMLKLKSGSSQERYRYLELFDPYDSRNARLDSVEELNLVQGVNDDVMMAIAADLTVYGDCKVNLNFASADQIALALRYAAKAADRWKTEGDSYLVMTLPLARYIVSSREFNLFKDLKAFQQAVEKPDQYLNPMLAMGASSDPSGLNLPRIPEGIAVWLTGGSNKEGDEWGGLEDIATVAPERVYRVEIISEIGAVKKRMTAVYDMQYVRSQSQGKGAWLYYRED